MNIGYGLSKLLNSLYLGMICKKKYKNNWKNYAMLTKSQIELYLRSPMHCPSCGSKNYEYVYPHCNECEKAFRDTYRLVDVEEL